MAQTVVIDIEARFIDRTQGVYEASRKLDQFSRTADKAREAVDRLGRTKTKPMVDAEDNPFLKKMARVEAKLRQIGGKRTNAVLDAVDRATSKIMQVWQRAKAFTRERFSGTLAMKAQGAIQTLNSVRGMLRGLVGRAWHITLSVKDAITAPIRKIMGSPVGRILSLAGLAGVGGTVTSGIGLQVTQQNLEAQYATMFGNNYQSLKEAMGGNIGMSEAQFNNLSRKERLKLGYEGASNRVSELTTFAGQTPFTRQEIYQADKILQAYTGGKLNNETDRTLVGDLAALGGTGYDSMATIMGRMYVNMAGGHGIGDSLMSLREMGVLSAEAEQKIQSLSKGVANGTVDMADAWKGVRGAFKDYSGMMEEMSNKLGNLLLGCKAFVTNNVLGKIGSGVSKGLVPFLSKFREWRNSDAGSAWIKNFGSSIESGAEKATKGITKVTKVVAGAWNEAFNPKYKTRTWEDMGTLDKLGLMWKNLEKSFGKWWSGNGKKFTGEIAKKIGTGLGDASSSLLKGLLGITGGDSAFGEAANTFARNFMDGLKESFDIKGVLDGMWETVKEHPILSLLAGGTLTGNLAVKLLGGGNGGNGTMGGGGGIFSTTAAFSSTLGGVALVGGWVKKLLGKFGIGKGDPSGLDVMQDAQVGKGGKGGKLSKLTKLFRGKGGKAGLIGASILALGGLMAALNTEEVNAAEIPTGTVAQAPNKASKAKQTGRTIGDIIGLLTSFIPGGFLPSLAFGAMGERMGEVTADPKTITATHGSKSKVLKGGKVTAKQDVDVKAGKVSTSKLTKTVKKKAKDDGKKGGKSKVTAKQDVDVKAGKVSTSGFKSDVKGKASEAASGKGKAVSVTQTVKTNANRTKGNVGGWKPSKDNLGLPKSITAHVKVNVVKTKGSVSGYSPKGSFRGGFYGANIPHYGDGGFVHGGSQLAVLAEEGTPEAVIPLGKHRRQRGRELWEKAGEYLGVKKFASGGIVGGSSSGGSHGGSGKMTVNVGGVTINVSGGSAESGLSDNKEKIAQEIAGIINDALSATYENMTASA